MSKTRLIIYSIVIVAVIIGVPHVAANNFNIPEYSSDTVNWFFYIFNDLSVLYIIVPFFVLELVRYFITKRLNRDLALDSVANVLTVGFFTGINYILGILFAFKMYAWAWEYRFFDALPMTWVTIVSCILLADFLYYWEHRLMHELAAGWVTHTVHHSSPHFNMSVAYRFGPLDGFFHCFSPFL